VWKEEDGNNPLSPTIKKHESSNDSFDSSSPEEKKPALKRQSTLHLSILNPSLSKHYLALPPKSFDEKYNYTVQYILANIRLYSEQNETIPACLLDMGRVIGDTKTQDAHAKLASLCALAAIREVNKPATCAGIFSRTKSAVMKPETKKMNDLIVSYGTRQNQFTVASDMIGRF
jgi:hypothetical protein